MSQLETPILSQGRIAANAGKDAKAKGGIVGREEKGSAFRALLQGVTGKAGRGMLAKVEKPGESAKPEARGEGGPAEPALAPPAPQATHAPQAPIPPMDGSVSSDAAIRLLGALQLPGRDGAEPGREPVKGDAAMALGGILADARHAVPVTDGARPGSFVPPGKPNISKPDVFKADVAEPPVAMPGDDAPLGDMPDLTALSRLSDLFEDEAPVDGAGTDKAPGKPLSVTVTRQETYLPPVMRISPFQQVVEPLRQAVSDMASVGKSSIPDLGADTPAEISAPTKVLHIELRPVELGTITVKMRLSQGGMEIRLEASRAETAQMLANDKDALREVVRASGFAADAVSVETVHVDTISDRQPSNPGQGGGEDRYAARDGQGRGFDQSRQGENRQEPRQRVSRADSAATKDDSHDPNDAGRLRRDPLRYL